MKTALIHYWLVTMRGGERVLEALCELFPEADIFTHVYDPDGVSDTIRRHRVRTTFIQRLPMAKRLYQSYLPFMPLALEQLDLRAYDLVISSESGPAKGVVLSADTVHICYCHTPMRYVWDMYHDYLRGLGRPKRFLMRLAVHYLRIWDLATVTRVDHFVANSHHVARRIRRHYGRNAEVIYPPVDTGGFSPAAKRDDFYLMVGQMVPYKRADLAIEAFNRMGRKLVVIGEGSEEKILRRRARPNITFLGRQPFEVIRSHYARSRALIFPGEEDFGIVPVEAMASGTPVIAFGKGGARETVVEGVTGLFFESQTVESLVDAVERLESQGAGFSAEEIARHARKFDRSMFMEHMMKVVERRMGRPVAESPAEPGVR